MIEKYRLPIILSLIPMVFLLTTGIYRVQTKGIPFVRTHDNWSLGIYTGDTPFLLSQPADVRNPVLTVLDVTDAPAHFLADPFMVYEAETYYMFFEIYNLDTRQGDLSVATSRDGRNWTYQQIILDEPFHLSYPYVFKWEGGYYLVPESYEANSVRLYRAKEFPHTWQYVATLLEGRDFLDNSLAYYNDYWWLFSSFEGNDTLRLYYAADLYGPWQEHPLSPIIEGNLHHARPGGRVLAHDGRLFRYTQDGVPRYGSRIWAFEIPPAGDHAGRTARLDGRPQPLYEPGRRGLPGHRRCLFSRRLGRSHQYRLESALRLDFGRGAVAGGATHALGISSGPSG
jgi:hypothetical protein